MNTLFIAALFLAVAAFLFIYFLLDKTAGDSAFREARLNARLSEMTRTNTESVEKKNRYSDIRALNRILMRQAFVTRFNRMLQVSGWGISMGVFILGSMVGAFLAFGLLYKAGITPWVAAPVAAIMLWFIPTAILKYRYNFYLDLFSQRFPAALQIIHGAIGVGFGLSQALARVAKDAPHPVNKEFAGILAEIQLGENLINALSNLYKRIPTSDVKTFVIAISIQHDSGGNLSELIGNLEKTINARVLLRKELSALTAQAKMSGKVLVAIPFCLAAMLYLINPDYLRPLFEEEMGRKVIMYTLAQIVVGTLVIRKMVNMKLTV